MAGLDMVPGGVQVTLLTKAELLYAYRHVHEGGWDFVEDRLRTDLPRVGSPVMFRLPDGARTIYEAVARSPSDAVLYQQTCLPPPDATYAMVLGYPSFVGVVNCEVDGLRGIAFRTPELDRRGQCAFVADKHRLAFWRGTTLVVRVAAWGAPTACVAATILDVEGVEAFSAARDRGATHARAPEVSDADREWFQDAFETLDRLSNGWLTDYEIGVAEAFHWSRLGDPTVTGHFVGDETALRILTAATTGRDGTEVDAALRFARFWPSSRAALMNGYAAKALPSAPTP